MNSHELISDFNPSTEITNGFQHFVGGFFIDLPCILCKNKTVYVQDIYSLVDFLDHGGIKERAVKFFHSYLTGYKATIVILDLQSGELLKRSHRMNNDSLPCDWVLIEHDFLHPKSEPED